MFNINNLFSFFLIVLDFNLFSFYIKIFRILFLVIPHSNLFIIHITLIYNVSYISIFHHLKLQASQIKMYHFRIFHFK